MAVRRMVVHAPLLVIFYFKVLIFVIVKGVSLPFHIKTSIFAKICTGVSAFCSRLSAL